MGLIRILENDDWIVDYDKKSGQYRVSYFEDNHFRDELWFDAYEEKVEEDVVARSWSCPADCGTYCTMCWEHDDCNKE